MAIGQRIRFFRMKNGMSMKYLGVKAGFGEATADSRIAQYETGLRVPKDELTEKLAGCLGVSPNALTVPDIDSLIGLMHTLFALEDGCGLTVELNGGEPQLRFQSEGMGAELVPLLREWAEQKQKLDSGAMSRDEYDEWRYRYPLHGKHFHRMSPAIDIDLPVD